MSAAMNKFRIISQWRPGKSRNWGFVPFSIWSTEDFFGVVLFNYCFEWTRSETAKVIPRAF